ncbi:MAG TPA: VWA domain-containing protein [Candidatus Acidoferrum sp.]
MKSLRKIAFVAGVVLLTLGLAYVPLRARAQQSPASQEARPPQQGSAAPAQAPNPPPQQPQQQQPPPIRAEVRQVVVPVTVKDPAGRLVPDLRKDEFRILEDDVEQRIISFTADAMPLSLVLLIDNDLKRGDARQVAESLDSIIAGLSTSDEAFVCRFDTYVHEGHGFISDQDKLLTELKRTRLDDQSDAGPSSTAIIESPTINGHSATGDAPKTPETTMSIGAQSSKALDDAVYTAAQLLKDRDPQRKRRKMILLISDGVNNSKLNTNKYDAVIKDLLRYEISVYGVGVGSAVFNRRFERLAKYAKDSGGDVYYGLKSRDMEDLYSRVTEEARNQYTLVYSPTGTDRSKDYHSIEVRVKRPGLGIHTRQGYYSGAGH